MSGARLHPRRPSSKPVGQATRGKTASNRLRRIDRFLSLYDPLLLGRDDGAYAGAYVVDLGYGAEPVTTLEMAEWLHGRYPELRVLGVEIDPARVAAAKPYETDRVTFRLGGFNLPLNMRMDGSRETVRAVRAFNVLRQYDASAVVPALTELAHSLLPGALVVEGTSDPNGRVWSANLFRRIASTEGAFPFEHEGLVFGTNFRAGVDPAIWQPVLPKNYIHRMVPGEPVYEFFQAWKRAARETAGYQAWGPRAWFLACAERLRQSGCNVVCRRKFLRNGLLVVREQL